MKAFIVLSVLCAVTYGGSVPRLDGRIVGGKEVDIADYPYQVSVRLYDQHICGGSIIDESTVLTAGHCVYEMDHSQYSVRVGNTNHADGESIKVSMVIEHPRYNPNIFDRDLAILKLATPLTFSSTIQPIKLDGKDDWIQPGAPAQVSGWGVEEEGSETIPSRLRAVDVNVVSNGNCTSAYGFGKITPFMMCAQAEGRDSCQGDSGGPLVAFGKLIGVVSWGYGCASPRYPGVYASVSYMNEWIVDNK